MVGNTQTKKLKRTTILALILACAAVFLLIRILLLGTLGYEKYQSKVIEQMTTEMPVKAKRGTIYDRNGKILATNRTAYNLFISPWDISKADEATLEGETPSSEIIANGIAEILGDSTYYGKVIKNYTEHKNTLYRSIQKNIIDDATIDALTEFIAENELSTQVYLEATSIRYYPYGDVACHLIGFCDSDGNGLYGLEYQYNDVLSGVDGKTVTARDAYGNEMSYDYESYIAAIDGSDLYTTIDVEIQMALDEECEQSLVNTGSRNGTCGIVMDPDTGGILAMSSAPAFDLNSPWKLVDYYQKQLEEYALQNGLTPESDGYIAKQAELRQKMWANKAITEAFIPGSTFKIITSAMALENNVVRDVYTTDSRCTCETIDSNARLGSTSVGGVIIHCHSKHHAQNFAEGLMNSCNITFINMGLDIGAARFYAAFKAFGYLDKTGIDLPGEGNSIMHSLSGLGIVELATSAFGQNFKITGIQHITAVNAVVNGGRLLEPFVVDKVVDKNGNTTYSHGVVEVRRVASEETCETLRVVLEECVSGGYGGKNCYVPGYRVAAKTGTSEKVGDDKDLRIGSVMSFAPAEDPVATAFFMCDEPDPEYGSTYGSTVAAPYMQGLMEQILPVLSVETKYSESEKENVDTAVPSVVGWSVSMVQNNFEEWYGMDFEIIGDGNIVRYQMPAAGTYIKESGAKIYLYTSKSLENENQVTVPNVVGMTAEAAMKTLINRGFNVKIVGTSYYNPAEGVDSKRAIVLSQSIPKGTIMTKGSVVTINFDTADEEYSEFVGEAGMPVG